MVIADVVKIADQLAHFLKTVQEDGMCLPMPPEEIAIHGVEIFTTFFGGQLHHAVGDTLRPRHDP